MKPFHDLEWNQVWIGTWFLFYKVATAVWGVRVSTFEKESIARASSSPLARTETLSNGNYIDWKGNKTVRTRRLNTIAYFLLGVATDFPFRPNLLPSLSLSLTLFLSLMINSDRDWSVVRTTRIPLEPDETPLRVTCWFASITSLVRRKFLGFLVVEILLRYWSKWRTSLREWEAELWNNIIEFISQPRLCLICQSTRA